MLFRKRIMRRVISKFCFLVVMLVVFTSNAQAQCSATSMTMNFGNVTVADNAAVGSTFGSASVTVTYNCTSNVIWQQQVGGVWRSNDIIFQMQPPGPSTSINYVYPTNVPGVGIRIREQSTNLFLVMPGAGRGGDATNSFCWRTMTGMFNDEGCGRLPSNQCPLTSNGGSCRITTTGTLVKTGAIQAGTLSWTAVNLGYYAPGVSVGNNRIGTIALSGLISVGSGGGGTTCRFSVSPNPVDMGSVPLNSLSVGGSSPEKIINITAANCSGTNARMNVKPMVATIGTNCSGQMENTGSARGVGIALSYDGPDTYVPVCWNQDFTPWEDVRSPTVRRYRFSVAMRRFQQNATGGTVQGRIIVTVNYP